DVLKVAIYGCKADVRHLVDLLQTVHDQLAQLGSGALALRGIDHELLHIVDDLLHASHGDRALFASPQHAGEYFLTLELFAPPIFLHHHVRDLVDALVGGETLFTLQALAAAADRRAFLALARVDDFVVFRAAKWAFHGLGTLIEVSLIVSKRSGRTLKRNI